MIAAKSDELDVIKVLRSEYMGLKDSNGHTALDHAIMRKNCNSEVVKLLSPEMWLSIDGDHYVTTLKTRV